MLGLERFGKRRREAELDRLENAAAISAALYERITLEVGDGQRDWPGGYRCHAFVDSRGGGGI